MAENPGADASRRAMQDAGQQVSDLLEQQTYRQLSKPQTTITPAEPLLRAAENEHCLPVSGVYLRYHTVISGRPPLSFATARRLYPQS